MRVHHSMARVNSRDFMIQEACVERRVVGYQHRIAHEVEPLRSDVCKHWSAPDHVVRNTGERRDEAWNRNLRIDERVKLIDDAPAANAISAELDEAIGRSLGAGRFDVDDHEIEIFQESQMTVVFE